jgi:alkanesulfonate monooxygenase SsuD/methylene tetrahydromethanopterin reductase-like flavin-dependent oxidoreductase (luciferase family)
MLSRGGPEVVFAEMPEEWVDTVAIAGGLDQARARIREYLEAGSDKVVVATVVPHGPKKSIAAVRSLLAEFPA